LSTVPIKADYIELGEIGEIQGRGYGVWGAHRETAIGLAAQIFKFMTKSGFDPVLEESSGVTKKTGGDLLEAPASIKRGFQASGDSASSF